MERPLSALTKQELAKIYRQEFHKVNRRMQRLEKGGHTTPALEKFWSSGLTSKTRDKSISQLQKDIKQLRYIDALKTSTVRGAKEYENTFGRLQESFKTGEIDKDDFFDVYGRLVEEYGIIELVKYQVMDVIGDTMKSTTDPRNIRSAVQQFLKEQDFLPAGESVQPQFYSLDKDIIDIEFDEDTGTWYHTDFDYNKYKDLRYVNDYIDDTLIELSADEIGKNPYENTMSYQERMEMIKDLKTEMRSALGEREFINDNKATREEVERYLSQISVLDSRIKFNTGVEKRNIHTPVIRPYKQKKVKK